MVRQSAHGEQNLAGRLVRRRFSEKSRLFGLRDTRSVRRAPWRQRCTRCARRSRAARGERRASHRCRRAPVGFVAARAGRLGRFPHPDARWTWESARRRRRAERRGPRAIRQARSRLRRGEAGKVPRARARSSWAWAVSARPRPRTSPPRASGPAHPRGRRRRGAEQPAPASRRARWPRPGGITSKALSAATAIAALNPRTNVRTHLEGVTEKRAGARQRRHHVVHGALMPMRERSTCSRTRARYRAKAPRGLRRRGRHGGPAHGIRSAVPHTETARLCEGAWAGLPTLGYRTDRRDPDDAPATTFGGRIRGQVTGGSCLRWCRRRADVGNCAPRGVLGPVPGALGRVQALEAVKVLERPRRAQRRASAVVRRDRGPARSMRLGGATRAAPRPPSSAGAPGGEAGVVRLRRVPRMSARGLSEEQR